MSHLFISGPIGINRADLRFFHENVLKSGSFRFRSHVFISGPIDINRADLSFFEENMLKSGEFSVICLLVVRLA